MAASTAANSAPSPHESAHARPATYGHRIADILALGQDPKPTAVQSSSSPAESSVRGPLSTRRRRPRTVFTAEQRQHLEDVFAVNRYPDIGNRDVLAEAIGVTEARVQVWFQNRRARHRRQGRGGKSPEPAEDLQPSSREASPVAAAPESPTAAAVDRRDRPESPLSPQLAAGASNSCSPPRMYPSSPLVHRQFPMRHPCQPLGGVYAASRSPPSGFTVATVPGGFAPAYSSHVRRRYLDLIVAHVVFDASTPGLTPDTDLRGYAATGGLLAIAR